MRIWTMLLGLVLAVSVFGADRTPAPLPADKAAKTAVLPDGFQMTVFAAEPDIVQPISFCSDARGRLWVAEALNYGEWKATGKDRVVILEERHGKLHRTVFYEGFNYITGIEVGFGGVWVMSPPCLYFVPDRNQDDKPDGIPEVVFDGFGYQESRHNLANGFTWGPDGWLYGGHGRTSPSDVGRPGTPPSKRTHCDGGVFRIHPTRLVFENFADGTTNPWGVDFNDHGRCFVSNCVNPHLFHVISGGHYEPWRNRPSSLYAYERLATCADHLHYPSGKQNEMRGETPEALSMGGGHAHCGTLIYLGDSFPKEFRNSVFMCNVHGRRINNDILKSSGSGYTASHGRDFMLSADPWFMGVTLRPGPDGSVFVSDWSDTGECHTYKPDRTSGRIFRISYGNAKSLSVDLDRLSDTELVELQLHSNDWFVRHARRILQERAPVQKPYQNQAIHTAVRKILDSNRDAAQRLRALWALHVTGGLDVSATSKLLDDRNEQIRGWAVQLLCEQGKLDDQVLAKLAVLAREDPSPVVRLDLASALQRLPIQHRWSIAEGLLSHAIDSTDANLPLMIWYGVEPLVPVDPARALQVAITAKIPPVRQFIARRCVDAALAKGESGDLTPLVTVLSRCSNNIQLDLLKGANEALRGRKTYRMPEGWPAAYAMMMKSENAELRETAMVLAIMFGDPQALVDLRNVAVNTLTPATKRIRALETLIDKRVADLAPLLHDQLTDKVTRTAALRGLAVYSHADTPKKVLAVYSMLSTEEKSIAVATLATRSEYALALLEAVDAKVVPRGDISAFIARQMFALNDKKVTATLKSVWGEVRETAADKLNQLAKYRAQLTPAVLKAANLSNGRLVFSKTCQHCHMLFGEGGSVGPDLTGTNRSNLEYLLSNVIDPNAEVGRDFRLSVVRTTDARVISGIVTERTPGRIVVQTATEKTTIAIEEVESVKDSSLSIMPEGQLDALTKDQVRDLIAYLASKSQVPLPGK